MCCSTTVAGVVALDFTDLNHFAREGVSWKNAQRWFWKNVAVVESDAKDVHKHVSLSKVMSWVVLSQIQRDRGWNLSSSDSILKKRLTSCTWQGWRFETTEEEGEGDTWNWLRAGVSPSKCPESRMSYVSRMIGGWEHNVRMVGCASYTASTISKSSVPIFFFSNIFLPPESLSYINPISAHPPTSREC